MANPQLNLGSLNRVKGSISFVDNPSLNITASFLSKDGITLTLEGETTTFIQAMTGVVVSPEPYQMVTLVAVILKTTSLATLFKARMESNSMLGDVVLSPDSSNLPKFTISNCAIEGFDPVTLNGTDAGLKIKLRGAWNINSSMWA